MAARGPDDAGTWFAGDGRVGFAHRRLSIIDLSERSAQPMLSADGNLVITFNGEIYNYRALRRELEAEGRTLPHAIRHRGPAASLRGEGRGDGATICAACSRSRSGTPSAASCCWPATASASSRFYYADDGWTFRFASQVKALLAGGSVQHGSRSRRSRRLLSVRRVPEPFTTYAAIRALPAGCSMTVGATGVRAIRPYYSSPPSIASARPRAPMPTEAGRAGARRPARQRPPPSRRRRAGRRLPFGRHRLLVALVGLMRDAGQNEIATVTLGFAEFAGTENDETQLAESVARRYATRHVTRLDHRAGVRRRAAADPAGDGPALDRRLQHLVRQQGGARAGPRRWRSRASAATSCSAGFHASLARPSIC